MKNVDNLLIRFVFDEVLNDDFSFFTLAAEIKKEFDYIFKSVDPISVYNPETDYISWADAQRYIIEKGNIQFSITASGIACTFYNYNEFTTELLNKHVSTMDTVLNYFNLNKVKLGIVIGGDFKLSVPMDEFLKEYINLESLKDSCEYQISYRNVIHKNEYRYNEWVRFFAIKDTNSIKYELDINNRNDGSSSGIMDIYNGYIYNRLSDFIDE